jgi:hypothetical protein
LAAGAALSWCLAANSDLDAHHLAAALDVHSFQDPSAVLGRTVLALGDAHRSMEVQVPNMSILCLPLYQPGMRLGEGPTSGVTEADFARVEEVIGQDLDALPAARSNRADGALVVEELRAGADLAMLLCQDSQARLRADGTLAGVPPATRRQLAARLEPMLDRHRALWMARNRPGGLPESVSWLERLLSRYRS